MGGDTSRSQGRPSGAAESEIRSSLEPRRRRIRFGDFKIDLDDRLVTLRDHELRLTSEEFDVLAFLIAIHEA